MNMSDEECQKHTIGWKASGLTKKDYGISIALSREQMRCWVNRCSYVSMQKRKSSRKPVIKNFVPVEVMRDRPEVYTTSQIIVLINPSDEVALKLLANLGGP